MKGFRNVTKLLRKKKYRDQTSYQVFQSHEKKLRRSLRKESGRLTTVQESGCLQNQKGIACADAPPEDKNMGISTDTAKSEYLTRKIRQHGFQDAAPPPSFQHYYTHDEERDEDQTEEEMTSESEEEEDDSCAEDMRKLDRDFKDISLKYRLITKIGEGTFSTVYKAEQLPTGEEPSEYVDDDELGESSYSKARRPKYVALKKIYVTSSPQRILNELEILYILRDSSYICPLLTAFRHQDQVVAVLPYFRHLDFRHCYRNFGVPDMRHYFHSLFSALQAVHRAGIIHRDIKPTNFLYNKDKRHGVLVDFGLAEKEGTDWQPCMCLDGRRTQRERFKSAPAVIALANSVPGSSTGYPKNDTRPSRRANRAGTRGFRAPEVLLKCTSQTTKLDMWSCGVLLLTLLAQRFPFFNSADDIDATIELASLFGRKKMRQAAALHGLVFECNIDTISEHGFSFEKIIMWAADRGDNRLTGAERQAVGFLEGLLEVDPQRRLSAKEALAHDFFTAPEEDEDEDQEEGEGEEEVPDEDQMVEDGA